MNHYIIMLDSVCPLAYGIQRSFPQKCEQAQLKMHKRIMAVYEFHHKHVIVLSPPE